MLYDGNLECKKVKKMNNLKIKGFGIKCEIKL